MFIPSVHAKFRGSGKRSFKVILEITKGTIKCLFYGTGTRPERVLTKNIRRVRDLEDKILCPRAMATYAFFAITFFF